MFVTVIIVACWTLVAALIPHTAIFLASANWHLDNAALAWSDLDQVASRNAHPPWYVRYSNWLEDRRTVIARAVRRGA